MNPEDAVLDEIDRLVDESLAKPWDRISGYDNDINQPQCRCGLDWHGLPRGYCPGSDTEGPIDDPWSRRRAKRLSSNLVNSGTVFVAQASPDPEGQSWSPLGTVTAGPRFTYAPEFSFSTPQWPRIGPSYAELFHRASEIFPEIFAELSVTFQNLTAAVETSRERLGAWQEPSEEPQTPQQRALPRPSTTPPMWAPRADGRRRH
ncbi:hypothetical protein EF294_03360 [Gordonia oryzae]|uniref:Uncharacterized protein n=1 Tax=Gordonia oryzae TaxID=2487349 RepID=A0A3N4GWI1_9ACTN|nr:hypothetical protein [Gordonia oryzae]RPA65787.1 hypothetical protein EF294_03360 [Gordonia oryzae]